MRLAELVNQLLGIRRRRHTFIKKGELRSVAVAQRIEPVLYLFATPAGTMDMEVELIITNAERPLFRHRIVYANGAAKNEQDHHKGDQFVGPYEPE